jgi:hypothetical protein
MNKKKDGEKDLRRSREIVGIEGRHVRRKVIDSASFLRRRRSRRKEKRSREEEGLST